MGESHIKENSYGNILKRISSFGGVQVFNIFINLVRGKFVAMFLGPEGMGITSLFTSSTNTLQQMAGLGLNLAVVKEIAAEKDNPKNLSHVLAVALRMIIFTTLLGGAACFLLSPLLSFWSFGNYDYTLSFMALAACVSLLVAGAGYLSLLQGMGEVKRLAKASVVGGLTGLFCGVPLYYFFGDRGIVPAMIILSLAIFLFYFFSFKTSVETDKVSFSWQSHKPLVKKLITLGLILMLGSLSGTFTNYIINIFVRSYGSVDNVGLFQAANSLTNQYVGVIFSALALDYFPRLSAVSQDKIKLREVVNRQAEIVILITTPLVLLLILTTPLVIELLLTEKFLVITPLMRWLGLGVLFQSVSFPMGYIFIARENKKAYIWLEIVFTNLLWIACSFGFYYAFGLIGLGVSLVTRAVLDVAVTYAVCRSVYGFRYSKKVILVIGSCVCLGIGGFVLSLLPGSLPYVLVSAILTVSIIFSFFMLRKGLRSTKESKSLSIQED